MRIWSDEDGMATLPTVVAATFALATFVLLANLVLVQYARGVARTAVDEAVRRASVAAEPSSACAAALTEVLSDLLGGSFGAGLDPTCQVSEGVVVASITGVLPAILPAAPTFSIRAEASALIGGDW
ncbi:MAG: hypothetical protein WD532_03545 [Acidimicrobiia bacterium]